MMKGQDQVLQLQLLIDQCNQIVFFGGAGVSTESGLPDFRSVDGLYQQKYAYPPETMLSRSFFDQHTAEFYDFYRAKLLFPDARPNAAHRKLAELEKAGRLIAVITQNIDGLHQMAGSRNILELHGSVHRNYCMRCQAAYDLDTILHSSGVPHCQCGGVIKPDVVLYEEDLDPLTLRKSTAALRQADLLIVGGTSLAVYPAAGLIQDYHGHKLVLINKQPSPIDRLASLAIYAAIGQVLDQITVK
jgi:NAD-dependent deacetylase